MSSWIAYKGLNVPGSPTGDAGIYLKSDLQALADRVGPCNFTATTNPGSSNDVTQGYQIGSFWINTATSTWFVCTNNAPAAAVWGTYQAPIVAGTGIAISGATISNTLATATQAANRVFAGPTGGSAATPGFRTLTAADMPSGVVPVTEVENVDGSGNLTFTNPAANVYLGVLNADNVGATQTLTLPTSGVAANATAQLTINGASAGGWSVFTLPDSTLLYVAAGAFVSVTLAWNGTGWINTTPQQGMTETGNTAGDGSGNVTFANPNADVFYAVLMGSDTSVNATLPTASGPRLARIVANGSSIGAYPSSITIAGISIGEVYCTGATQQTLIDVVLNAAGVWSLPENDASRMSVSLSLAGPSSQIFLRGLPTSSPMPGHGQLWSNSGVVSVS